MSVRWKFATVQTDPQNCARIASMSFRFQPPAVTIEYELGDDSRDSFIVKRHKHIEVESPLPTALEALMKEMSTHALAYLRSKEIIPAGTMEEVRPSQESDVRVEDEAEKEEGRG